MLENIVYLKRAFHGDFTYRLSLKVKSTFSEVRNVVYLLYFFINFGNRFMGYRYPYDYN